MEGQSTLSVGTDSDPSFRLQLSYNLIEPWLSKQLQLAGDPF